MLEIASTIFFPYDAQKSSLQMQKLFAISAAGFPSMLSICGL
jgi:hypothetical protein